MKKPMKPMKKPTKKPKKTKPLPKRGGRAATNRSKGY